MKAEELDQLKVLVVDDESLIRLFLVEELIDRGWQVYEAADGIEALVVIEHHPEIELVFSDLRMPGMNGIELLRIVHERWPSILLIISSGHTRLTVSSQMMPASCPNR